MKNRIIYFCGGKRCCPSIEFNHKEEVATIKDDYGNEIILTFEQLRRGVLQERTLICQVESLIFIMAPGDKEKYVKIASEEYGQLCQTILQEFMQFSDSQDDLEKRAEEYYRTLDEYYLDYAGL